ncbi:MAG: type II secretion system major pseudopilin GspG [Pseudomonadota bacterium]|nr:type II secretion system major pseudopilin GspG [Pseudomonadota bacterium]
MHSQKGFTLLEILIAITLLVIIGGVMVSQFGGVLGQNQVKLTQVGMDSVATALDTYRADNARYPTTDQGLEALVNKPDGAKFWPTGGYLKKLPQDGWGNDYIYSSQGSTFELISLGADAQEGGEGEDADITYQ